jgi:L-asparaginase/N4-(beta-N-acetylglucosaminyl)-L-asparaginase
MPDATPVAVATWEFGLAAARAAGRVLADGGAALDAVERGINVAELDPEVTSVGYGGLPNADGEVELDAAVMTGADLRSGAVAALRRISRPVSVARCVMEDGRHAMLVGAGALRFALERGFVEEELLTEAAAEKWRQWRDGKAEGHDTIGLIALDAGGRLAAGCSTSGLAWKLPGRVGDSPLVGPGLYADDAAGAAVATGVGEEIIRFCAAFLAVELMRGGAGPEDACAEVIRRVRARRSGDSDAPVSLLAVSPDGRTGAATTRDSFPYATWTPDAREPQMDAATAGNGR